MTPSQRKALLVSRSELERLQIALLVHELRERVTPERLEPGRGRRAGTVAAALVGVGLPLLGRKRLSRWLSSASLAMTAWRVARQWRGGRS
ncbi:MAG: hypothetical protein EHM87_11225 [Burkholderiales bacterium]|nr:MAG: hypothetical protein EHM87_11225 [Burkholderiales bacterium]